MFINLDFNTTFRTPLLFLSHPSAHTLFKSLLVLMKCQSTACPGNLLNRLALKRERVNMQE